MIEVGVAGIGVLGPGLADWTQARALLREPALWQRAATLVGAPQRLPATERRRASNVVKASILVADQAVQMAGADAATLATVFTSSTGDPLNCHLLCEALAAPGRLLSPTRFTNSVHNAPAGYWHIATASRAASTSLAAYDASLGAGLLEAAVQCRSTNQAVLLVACDVPYPEPLHTLRPVADVFALALLLLPAAAAGRGLQISLAPRALTTVCVDAGFEAVRRTIPAARALPLLQVLAGQQAASVALDNVPGTSLLIEIAPT